jgi:hypothetical protein
MRSITNKNQRGIKRNMPARRVVQSHRAKSVNTHPVSAPTVGTQNAFELPGFTSDAEAAALYQSGNLGPGK